MSRLNEVKNPRSEITLIVQIDRNRVADRFLGASGGIDKKILTPGLMRWLFGNREVLMGPFADSLRSATGSHRLVA